MDSHESKRSQFLFSRGHRFSHKVASEFVHKSDIVPLSLGYNYIDRVYKKNPAVGLDRNSRNFVYPVILSVNRIQDLFAGW